MAYCLADVAHPETLTRAMDRFFGAERELAIACIGIAYLVPDAVVAALFQALHAWCAPGSIMAVSFGVWIGADRVQVDAALAAFRRHANTTMYIRTTEEFAALASPWRLTACRSLPDWLDVPDMFTPEEMELRGAGMNGAFFEH
jgi:O-methyltransferase involved in polyketide biosynthesis